MLSEQPRKRLTEAPPHAYLLCALEQRPNFAANHTTQAQCEPELACRKRRRHERAGVRAVRMELLQIDSTPKKHDNRVHASLERDQSDELAYLRQHEQPGSSCFDASGRCRLSGTIAHLDRRPVMRSRGRAQHQQLCFF